MWYRIFLLVFVANLFMGCGSTEKKDVNTDSYKTIGAQIRAARLQQGVSQQDLADEVGVTQNGLSLIEDGLATPIHTKLIAIQNYLEVEFKFDGKHTSIEAYLENKE